MNSGQCDGCGPGRLAAVACAAAIVGGVVGALVGSSGESQASLVSPASASALGISDPWTAVASDGTVDEADLGLYNVAGTVMALVPNAPDGSTLNVRYSIPNTIPGGGLGTVIVPRFRDNGSESRVRVFLKQMHRATGATTTLIEFDSDDFAPSSAFQREAGTTNVTIDAEINAYFLDVELRKSGPGGMPGLSLVEVDRLDV